MTNALLRPKWVREGCNGSKEDSFYFALAGALVWGAATLFYAAFAGGLIERAFWFYALNAALATAALTFFFHVTAGCGICRRVGGPWRR